MKGQTINDDDRAQWIDNDEGLYCWWKASGLSKQGFIRKYREEITTAIRLVLDGKKPAHFLRYGS